MSRHTMAIVAVLVLALLVSTAGLVAASRTMLADQGYSAMVAPDYAPQPADDDDDEGNRIKFEGFVDPNSAPLVDCTGTVLQELPWYAPDGGADGGAPLRSGVADDGDFQRLHGEIIVDGVTVLVNCDTKIKHGPPEGGDWVKVKGWPHPDRSNTVVAEEVEVKEHHDDEDRCHREEFYGKLVGWEGKDGDPPADPETAAWWLIGPDEEHGVKVYIDDTTEIEGVPVAGDLVKVEACRQTDGTLLARELEVRHHPDHDHGDRVEFRGTINKLPVGAPFAEGPPWKGPWLVGSWWVEVATDTAIVGVPQVERRAEVHGIQAPPGHIVDGKEIQVIASRIEIEHGHHPGQGVEIVKIEGAITDIPDPPTTVPAVWKIEGIPVMRTDTTLVDHHHIAPAVGVWAEVRAIVQRDSSGNFVSYDALRIKTEREHESSGEVHFEGTFDDTTAPPPNDNIWIVSGWEFDVSSVIVSAPATGTRVKIKAMYHENDATDPLDDTYVAFDVEVRGEDHH